MKADDNKPSKKTTKKSAKKTPKKSSAKTEAKVDDKADDQSGQKEQPKSTANTQKPSNDSAPLTSSVPKDYEVINEAPKKKKKGWWNRLVE